MRLAAKLTTVRDAERQPVELRGTMRDTDAAPRDVTILDVSTSGFRAELPADVAIDPGTRVRIAATAFGVHEAIAVRSAGIGHGFAFVRPIAADMLGTLEGEQPSTVTPFPNVSFVAAADVATVDDVTRLSARASLMLMVGISVALWLVLAAIVAGATLLH